MKLIWKKILRILHASDRHDDTEVSKGAVSVALVLCNWSCVTCVAFVLCCIGVVLHIFYCKYMLINIYCKM